MAGYSATPLGKKLGLKEGFTIFIQGAPTAYFDWIAPLPASVLLRKQLKTQVDFIHLFVETRNDFQQGFLNAKQYLKPAGMLWISWPKKASKVITDLDENFIRDFGLTHGLVDVKVCAVDKVWSGLKFVYRLKDR